MMLAEWQLDDGFNESCSVTVSSNVNADVKGRTDVFASTISGPLCAVLEDEGFESANRIEWAVGMTGGERAAVAGVHGGQHVEHLGSSDFPDDEPVRAHAQSGAEQ
jgi:hypothetical protein